MGLLSTVNGRRPGEPRPGYNLFALILAETPPTVGLATSIRQPVGLGRLPRCDAELNGVQRRRPSPFINSGVECGVWRQQGQRRRGSNRAIPPSAIHRATLRSHTLSGEMQGLPTKDGVMGKIADQKDRPRPDGNGNSRKQSPKSRPRKLRTRLVTKKPAINQTLSWPAGSCSPSGHHRQNNHPGTTSATWRMGVPGATGFGLGGVTPPVCRLQPADGCSDSTAIHPSPSRPPPLANVPGPRSDRPPRLTPGPAFVSGIG